jgi:hypothetical protein
VRQSAEISDGVKAPQGVRAAPLERSVNGLQPLEMQGAGLNDGVKTP